MPTLAASPRLLAALGLAASLASGCSDPTPAEPPPPPPTDERCPGPGISKGPWSLRADRTSAVVRWEACRQGVAGGVVFTPEGGGDAREATSTVTTYEVTTTRKAVLDPSAPPDEAGTYWTHEAVLSGLTPGACVDYHLAADPAAKGRVCAAKPDGADLRFLAIGDTNPGLNRITQKVLDQVLPMGPDFTLHGGDIQYYDSGLETYASWFPAMRPLLAQGAFFPALGNHELEVPEEYEAYYRRFFGGAGFDGAGDHYRFESGGVWFFSLDTEQPLGIASEQGIWLAESLADAASKPGYRFSVVFLHKPIVTCGDKSDDPATRAELEPLFVQHGVRLVIQAHMHGYERFAFPDLTWITTGGGGASLANVDENIDRPICAMRAASGTVRHAVILDATGKTLSGEVIDDKGTVWDTFVLDGP
ncbi:metallophosphoesterase family protein [Polyangium fumosum]|uniref:Calcineurin-like phosphoesterase domain-containing protein n=1 Tax=Polyangium fumosum TaxID=889272 RepID=A0A4U1JCK5_9BACT|nr:metallophosphoesterase [Polyangium fumosum]TKD08344.1 hypothetical protein E8A74_15580 [Polyangium fumosum]